MMNDPFGAFCKHCDVSIEGAAGGSLHGLTFAAKDNYYVTGFACCAGNPDWLRTHPPADSTAPAIRMLLEAGARLAGKTILDELAYSVAGENIHYGSPINPRAPGRTTGGSSCGSAAAVAGGLVDFALGSDTGGSVRVPASFCGLFGIRPTYGVVPVSGLVPHVPSADAVGWFARDGRTLRRVGEVLLGGLPGSDRPRHALVVDDLFALVGADARAALTAALERVVPAIGPVHHVKLCPEGFDQWREIYMTISFYEAWQSHAEWIKEVRPVLSPAIAQRYEAGSRVTPDEYRAATREREAVRARLDATLTDGAVLCLPTTPFIAPLHSEAETAQRRNAIFTLTCIASMCGVPQMNIPAAQVDGCPIGISLMGPRRADKTLLELAAGLDIPPTD
jgi:amidase